jgi:hypothetical protein
VKNLLIVLCLIAQSSFGQSKTIQIFANGWYPRVSELTRVFNLKNLTTSAEPFHFRFWTEIQVVDIWTTNNKTFQGKLIYYARESNEGRTVQDTIERIHSHITNIDTSTARQIYQFVNKQQLFTIPTQDSIKDWNYGYDGTAYFVEYSTPSIYSFKDYWLPEVQPFKEAKVIVNVLHYLQQTLNMDNDWYTYVKTLPKGCYKAKSLELVCNQYNRSQFNK